MLERALVKRLRDSDSEEEAENAKDRGRKPTADKPTDILTTDGSSGSQVERNTAASTSLDSNLVCFVVLFIFYILFWSYLYIVLEIVKLF